MAIQLAKNKGINLKKGLDKVRFTLRWDSNVDVDIQALVLKDGQSSSDDDLIFYNQLNHPTGAVKHSGDVRDGSKVTDGDDEYIDVTLSLLYPQKNQILFSASIDNAVAKGIDFGSIGKVTCELINVSNNEVLATYQVDKDLDMETCGVLCELKKDDNGTWNFNAVGQAYLDLESMLVAHGFDVVG